MLKYKIGVLVASALFCLPAAAQNQAQQPSLDELIAKEVERLETALKLEDWQVFYVDSTLHYNNSHMMEEIESMRRARVENSDLYYNVQDRWMVKTEEAYKKYFTEKQWAEYLKQGGEKIIKERQKRQAKAMQATGGKQKR